MTKARCLIFAVMFIVNIGLTLALLYLFVGRGYYVVAGFTSVEVVTIVLAALAIMITALGIFIAIMAIWGYQSLHSIARQAAERAAFERAEEVATRAAADALARLDAATGSDRDYGTAAGESDGEKTE